MKLLKNTYRNFRPTNLKRTVWQDGGPDAGVDSGMSSEYEEEDFAISTETDKEKARLEQLERLEALRIEAKEKRDQLTQVEFYKMVGDYDFKKAKSFCDFIADLYKEDLGKPAKYIEEDVEEITIERMKETLAQVAEIATEVVDINMVIELKKKSVSHQIVISSEEEDGDNDKLWHPDGIFFTLKNEKVEFCNLGYLLTIPKSAENDKSTKRQKAERERRKRAQGKLAQIDDLKEIVSKDKIPEMMLSMGIEALPMDFLEKLSYPLDQIAILQSNMEVSNDGEFIPYTEYDEKFSELSENVTRIIDDYIDNSPIESPEKETAIYQDLNKIKALIRNLFGIE